MSKSTPYQQAFAIGIIAGMRSATAPAFVSHLLSRNPTPAIRASRFRWFASGKVALLLKLCAAGELVADKLPFIPNRIDAGPLFGRIGSGALCGAALYRFRGHSAMRSALLGGLGAVAGAYGFYWLRRWAGQLSGWPDPIFGVLEDGIALAGCKKLNAQLSRETDQK